MSFTRQAGATGSDSSGAGSTTIATAAFNLVAGRLVVVAAKSEGAAGTIDSVSDTAGNTYVPLTGVSYAAGGDGRTRLFYCLSATGNAANVVTVTYSSGSSAYRYARAQSYSYDGTASFVDENGATANSTAADSGAATAGKMAAGLIAEFAGSTITAGAGWTETDSNPLTGGHFLDRVDEPGGTISCDATVPANYWAALIATFTDTGGSGPFDLVAAAPISLAGSLSITGDIQISAGDAQFCAPTSDVTVGSWSPTSGASLYAMLDETTPSDVDYIRTGTPADSCTVGLAAATDPAVSTGHVVSYRIQGNGTSGLTVSLRQGATLIASWTHDPAPTDWTTYAQLLTAGEADAITDYAALRLQFTEV